MPPALKTECEGYELEYRGAYELEQCATDVRFFKADEHVQYIQEINKVKRIFEGECYGSCYLQSTSISDNKFTQQVFSAWKLQDLPHITIGPTRAERLFNQEDDCDKRDHTYK